MANPKLILAVAGQPDIVSELHDKLALLTSQDVLHIDKAVLVDGEYRFELLFNPDEDLDLSSVFATIAVNGAPITTGMRIDSNRLILTPCYDSNLHYRATKPFHDAFGFVQIVVTITQDGHQQSLFSEFLQVLLRDNQETQELKAMADHIVKNHDYLLLKDGMTRKSDSHRYEYVKKDYDELVAICEMLDSIVLTYETYLGYFSKHCRTKLIQIQKKDNFEKLKSFTGQTLQFVLQHPEELTPVDFESGIKYGYQNYLPKHTLVGDSITSKITYENQVIVNFLQHLIEAIRRLVVRLNRDVNNCAKTIHVDGYVSSIDAILTSVVKRINDICGRLYVIEEKLSKLYKSYIQILPVPYKLITSMPQPSQVFIRVPVYRLFFDMIARWFALPEYNFEKERLLFSFLVNSRLYEYFVLVSQIEQMFASGFELDRSSRFAYRGTAQMRFYDPVDYANTFVFKNGPCTATLYFQPVIYGRVEVDDNGIGLRRITRLTWAGKTNGADYYLPDFVLKIDVNNDVDYVVIDAKYSSFDTVRRHYASELAFKYLLSMRTVKSGETLSGLQVYYGKRYNAPLRETSFWDLLESGSLAQTPYFSAMGCFAPEAKSNSAD